MFVFIMALTVQATWGRSTMLNFVIQYFTAWVDFYSGAGFSHRFFFLPNDTINVLAIVHTHVDTIPDSQPVWQRGGCWHPYSMLECPCGLMHALWTRGRVIMERVAERERRVGVWEEGTTGRVAPLTHSLLLKGGSSSQGLSFHN